MRRELVVRHDACVEVVMTVQVGSKIEVTLLQMSGGVAIGAFGGRPASMKLRVGCGVGKETRDAVGCYTRREVEHAHCHHHHTGLPRRLGVTDAW